MFWGNACQCWMSKSKVIGMIFFVESGGIALKGTQRPNFKEWNNKSTSVPVLHLE